MNGVASQHSQPQSLLNTSTISGLAGIADHTFGAGSTSTLNQQALQHSPHHDSTSQNDTNQTSDSPPPSDLEPLTTTAGEADALVLKMHPPGDEDGEGKPVVIKEGEVLRGTDNSPVELSQEHTPEPSVGSGDAEVMINDSDAQDWIPDADHELKRVKVYELIGSRWMDQGTAFCFGQFQEETNEALLIARSERNYHDIVLSTAIRSNDVYQRQQDTLIVWTEPDGVDYALSFQDPEGCAEVWNFILEVQRHMNNSDDQGNLQSSPHLGPATSANIVNSGYLPTPQLGIISEIERAIKALARTQVVKERICDYIQHEDYIKSLIEVMHTAEDLESMENLHALCSLMQTILMLNDHGIYEHILEDDMFFGVVGILEYDPDFPGHKANYREFLHNTSQFHQPIPLRDMGIQRKIHHTYRLQFLKDVVLARALDDSTFNVLNSCIIFNQIDIITHVQQDPMFLRDVVRLFIDEEMLAGGGPPSSMKRPPIQNQQTQPQTHVQQPSQMHPQHIMISLNGNGDNPPKPEVVSDIVQKASTSCTKSTNDTEPLNGRQPTSKRSGAYAFAPPDNLTEAEVSLRRDVIVLLQHLCIMGKNVQLPARMALFRTLVDRGVLFAVQWALNLPENDEANKQMFAAAGEVLTALLDHDLNGVRGHVLKQVLAIDKEREAGKKGADKAETILEMTCRIMAQSKELAVQSQIGDALKVWMDVPLVDPPTVASGSEAAGPKLPVLPRKDDPGTERYMEYFYKNCADLLFKPLMTLQEWKTCKEATLLLTREETNRYVYLCDLLHNFVLQHLFRSYFYVTSSNILPRVATLLKGRDKHLRHSAFRIFRLLLKQNNPNSHAQLMKHDILKPILDLTIQESRRDNLLSCSCQEYFENMRKDNIKDLVRFCMTVHETEIQQLAKSSLGGQRFGLFIRRWEMNNEPLPPESKPEVPNGRGWSSHGRALDLAEEDYFNADDDEEELLPTISQQWLRGSGATSPLSANNTGMKRKRRIGMGTQTKGCRPPLRTPQLSALVDYEEDDEEYPSNDQAVPSMQDATSKSIPDPNRSPGSQPSPTPSINTMTLTPSLSPGPLQKYDDDDDFSEALSRPRIRPQATVVPTSSSIKLMRPNEKRRRTDDDDDELLERLAKSSKKPDFNKQKEGFTIRSKNGDDPPVAKKIKVKFGAIGLAVATSPSMPATGALSSEASQKDG